MNFLIYVSSATKHFSEEDLKDLLIISRKNNTSLGITGMLLYSDDNFIQVIEGELKTINGLYEKISKDPRHKGILRLLKGEIQTRNFGEWSMGFKKITKEDFSMLSGYENLEGNSFKSIKKLTHQPMLLFLQNFLKINSTAADIYS